jgi:hypothetical protein
VLAGRVPAGAATVPEAGEPGTGVAISGDVTELPLDGVPPEALAAPRKRAISVSSTPRVAVAASPATTDPDGVEPFPEPRLHATRSIPRITVRHASVRLVIAHRDRAAPIPYGVFIVLPGVNATICSADVIVHLSVEGVGRIRLRRR